MKAEEKALLKEYHEKQLKLHDALRDGNLTTQQYLEELWILRRDIESRWLTK